MRRRFVSVAVAAVALCVGLSASGSAARDAVAARESAWVEGMGKAAHAWLLSVGATRGASYPFDHPARRDWHYVPRTRPGLALRDMTPPQRAAATALLHAGLSPRGAARAEAIMALESVLVELERSSRRFRDPANYAFVVFGTPGVAPWAWRVEGHHLSVNVTVGATGRVAVTPLFTGSNPARIPSGPRAGERVQRQEVELAIEWVASLDARQLAEATIQTRSLGDIVSGPGRPDALATPRGLAVRELTAPQQALLLRLIETYVGLAHDEFNKPYMDLVRAGLRETRVAWAGERRADGPFYYRIHGPRILIELDNTQGGGNHVHSVWRDPVNDFGRDDLRAHYRSAPSDHGHDHGPDHDHDHGQDPPRAR